MSGTMRSGRKTVRRGQRLSPTLALDFSVIGESEVNLTALPSEKMSANRFELRSHRSGWFVLEGEPLKHKPARDSDTGQKQRPQSILRSAANPQRHFPADASRRHFQTGLNLSSAATLIP